MIQLIEINSPYRQGVAFSLSSSPAFKGKIWINGNEWPIDKRKRISHVLPVSENKPYDSLTMDIDLKEGYLRIANASDFLDDYPELIAKVSAQTGRSREQFRGCTFTSGFAAANLYGNAFWVEDISEKRYRFHCNDHKMDDDFDDMIFDMEIMDAKDEC